MSSSSKIFLGILTVLPFFLIAIYIFAFFSSFMHIIEASATHENNPSMPQDFFKNFIGLMILIFTAALLSLGLLIYYIIHAVNNKGIDSNERLVWILIFVFAGMIGFPIYWYMRIWKAPTKELVQPTDHYQ